MTAAIRLSGLTKAYGDTLALDGVDLTVPEGSVFGFLGPNGAGKTTALKILTGLARPTAGSAKVFGMEAGTVAAGSVIGFLPDVPGFYDWMSAEEYLRFCGGLFGLDGRTIRERSTALLDMAGLGGVSTRVGGFSRGMKQRLGVAQALINAPRVLMLDEPTSALDPLGRRDVLDMIAALKGKTTVVFSTHILADVERVCDTVAVLDRGRVIAHAPIGELTSHAGRRYLLEIEGDATGLERAFLDAGWASALTREGAILRFAVSDPHLAGREIPGLLAVAGLALVRFEPIEVTLEDVFVEMVSQSDDREAGIDGGGFS